MKRYNGIGLMSGTSLDGIDLAYCEFWENEHGWRFELLGAETIAYDEQWYARLRCLDTQDARTFARTHVYYGHLLGRTLRSFIDRNELKPDFVASHGQTVFHQPDKNFTAQIGDGETMASYLPCPLVTNFRNKDVAMGGQGAPLVPFGERHLFPERQLFLNLGGIANLSFGGQAFDVAPCNMALNWLATLLDPPQALDRDGAAARRGQMDYALYDALEQLPFYAQGGPKSLGTEWFTAEILPLIAQSDSPVEDRLKTFVVHIVSRITVAMRAVNARNLPLVVTGGGAHNAYLMEELEKSLAGLGITIDHLPDAVIDFKEAVIFAFLGLQTLLGRPNTLATVTGAKLNVSGGSIHLPAGGWGKMGLI
jgi:anhydro-N-acetylmuramic acid kinase